MAAVPQDMVVFDGGQTSAQPEAAMAGPSQAATDHRQHRCLLSLDGGGVRGLSALLILENIMLQVNGKRKESGRHLELKQCDVFDLIGGTSTGGLIAIMLGRLHMDAKSCLERYYQFIPQVFKAPKPWKTRLNILAQIRPLYDSRKLEEFMLDTVARREGKPDGELAAKVLLQEPEPRGGREPDCRAFVCATAEADSETSLLRSYPVKFYNETLRPTIAQAALATTAAPTFFDKARIPILGTNGQAFRHLMDGALGANNPVEVVEQEARTSRRIWLKKPEGRVPTQSFVDCFVSIGTGVGQPQRIGSSVSAFLLSARLLRKRSRLLKNFATSGRRPTTPSPSTFGSSVVRGLNFMVIDEKNPEEDVDTFTERYVTDEVESQRIRDCAEILANKPLDPEGIGMWTTILFKLLHCLELSDNEIC
ncbi:Acyl transferase/acyl hydrolase/lysophospholipase [Rhypophila sp. PSN 637]